MSSIAEASNNYRFVVYNLNDAMRLAESQTTFNIDRALLIDDYDEKQIFLITLRGTNQSLDKNDPLGIPTVMKAFFAKTNIYYESVKERIFAEIPQGASIVMIGHSLGGMIAQQIAADRTVKKNYKLLNVLAIGSPYVPINGRECPLHRFADKADVIPWLGFSVKANLRTAKPAFAYNGYIGKPVLAHTESYRDRSYWMRFDAMGEPFGRSRIALV